MLSIRFVYFVATITVVIVESYSALDGANELRVAYQAALFGLTDEQGNDSENPTIAQVSEENDFNYQLEYNHHGDYGLETNEEVSEELGLTKMRHQPSIRIEKIEPSIDKSLE